MRLSTARAKSHSANRGKLQGERKAAELGSLAGHDGRPVTDCPYIDTRDTALRAAWIEAWEFEQD